jgi:hypothetical protein
VETKSLRVEYILDGVSNFFSWNARVTLAFKEYDLWELEEKVVIEPTYPTTLEDHNKKEIKEQRVILDSIKDHLIPHLYEKKKGKVTFYAFIGLFERKNMNMKTVLRNKLNLLLMSRYANVTSYLMRIT